jgi:hypothetical protein
MRRFSTPSASTGIKTLRIFARSSREQSERERRRSRRRRGPLDEARLATGFVTNPVSLDLVRFPSPFHGIRRPPLPTRLEQSVKGPHWTRKQGGGDFLRHFCLQTPTSPAPRPSEIGAPGPASFPCPLYPVRRGHRLGLTAREIDAKRRFQGDKCPEKIDAGLMLWPSTSPDFRRGHAAWDIPALSRVLNARLMARRRKTFSRLGLRAIDCWKMSFQAASSYSGISL